MDWEASYIPVKKFVTNYASEMLMVWNTKGELHEFDINNHEFSFCKSFLNNFNDFELIFPLCEAFVVYTDENELSSFDLKTGNLVSSQIIL